MNPQATLSEEATLLYDDLRQRIAQREAVLIVGAGVSVAASNGAQCAAWKGLLQNGIDRCVSLGKLAPGDATNLSRQLDSPDSELLLNVSGVVERKLRAAAGEYGLWLSETVGSLRATQPDIIRALLGLNLPFFTTNYDNLLEEVTGLQAVTWRDRANLDRVIRGDLQAIVHLHGYFNDPDSVVLGASSYEDVLRDEFARTTLRTLRQTKTFIFVGFGKGLRDPNFGAFLQWSQRAFADSPYRHFRLARETERIELQSDHVPAERLFVLSYGANYEDLLPFLQSLPRAASSQHNVLLPATPPAAPDPRILLDAIHAEIDEAKQHTKRGEPDVAIALLERLRTRYSGDFSNRVWFRVLANLGHAYEAKDQFDKAALLYLQAKDYEPSNVDAKCYEAVAYFFRGDVPKAFALAETIRNEHPQSTLARSVWIRSAPSTTEFSELENGVPDHLRESPDVAHALMLAAAEAKQFDKAAAYGERSLSDDRDSPVILEQLGGVVLDHARFLIHDLEPEIAPKNARAKAEEALQILQRAMDLQRPRGTNKAKASIHLGLAVANALLNRTEENDRHVRLAYDCDPSNSEVIIAFAINLAGRKEFSTSIAMLGPLESKSQAARLINLVAAFHLHRSAGDDDSVALAKLTSTLEKLPASDRDEQITHAAQILQLHAKKHDDEQAESLLNGPLAHVFSPVLINCLRAYYRRESGDVADARRIAILALSAVNDLSDFPSKRFLARELSRLELDAEAVALWKEIIRPTYLSQDVRMAVITAMRSEDMSFALSTCRQLRENDIYDEQCIRIELELLNRFNCVDTLGLVMEECIAHVEDEEYKKELRAARSLLGFELGRTEWMCTDAELLPSVKEATPYVGRMVVQLLVVSDQATLALDYAYELARRHYESKDANMAMIVSVLLGQHRGLKNPEYETVADDTAVTYREDDSTADVCWIIETSENPERARRELSPSHPLAINLKGKKKGDRIILRSNQIQERAAKIVDIKCKRTYRFQECMREFEAFFPGEQFIMQFTAGRSDTDEPNFEVLFKSVDQQIERVRILEDIYRKFPSVTCFAEQMSRYTIEASSHLASQSIPIRCCACKGKEIDSSVAAFDKADTLVIDEATLAALFWTKSYNLLAKLRKRIAISYGTLRELRRYCEEQKGRSEQGFLTKSGDRFVFRETTAQDAETYSKSLQDFLSAITSTVVPEDGQPLADLTKDDRQKLVKIFGHASAESMAIASQGDRVLWTDDFVAAHSAAAHCGTRRVWTQLVMSQALQDGLIDEDDFCSLSLGLLRFGYARTQVLPCVVKYAGEQAKWSVDDRDLNNVLQWFGNNDIPPRTVTWLASNAIQDVMLLPNADVVADDVVVKLLKSIASRNDGKALLRRFDETLQQCWPSPPFDLDRLRRLVQSCL